NKNNAKNEVGGSGDQRPETILVPDSCGILMGTEQLVDLVNIEIHTEENHSSEIKKQILANPYGHEWLEQVQEATGTNGRQPCDKHAELLEVPVVLFGAFKNKAVPDTRHNGLEYDGEDGRNGRDEVEIVLVNSQCGKAQEGRDDDRARG
ncbi:hypothetical protein H9X89_15650, partial [Faecalicatena contorta]|uniref:hypothetical protein n=1 Tax=Faecalicatena contorta TaxID=39482 RepID=UPI00195F6960